MKDLISLCRERGYNDSNVSQMPGWRVKRRTYRRLKLTKSGRNGFVQNPILTLSLTIYLTI